jgi:hypothetical protein
MQARMGMDKVNEGIKDFQCIPERDDHVPTGFQKGDPCQCGAKRIVLTDGECYLVSAHGG